MSVLRASVRRAQEAMPPGLYDLAWIHQVLADLAAALTPVAAHLEVTAAEDPAGAVAAALVHLRDAFAHAAAGRLEQAASCVVAAKSAAFGRADDTGVRAIGFARCR